MPNIWIFTFYIYYYTRTHVHRISRGIFWTKFRYLYFYLYVECLQNLAVLFICNLSMITDEGFDDDMPKIVVRSLLFVRQQQLKYCNLQASACRYKPRSDEANACSVNTSLPAPSAGILTQCARMKAACKGSVFFRVIATTAALLVLTNVASFDDNRRAYVAFDRASIGVLCQFDQKSPVGHQTSLRVLVSFVYYETESMRTCELANKRNNLATFLLSAVSTSPTGISFVITFSGRKPDPSDILNSSGLSPESEAGKFITTVLSKQAKNVELLASSVNHSAADLCHHHSAIADNIRRRLHFDFVLVLNDGVRGPFFGENKNAQMVWSSKLESSLGPRPDLRS